MKDLCDTRLQDAGFNIPNAAAGLSASAGIKSAEEKKDPHETSHSRLPNPKRLYSSVAWGVAPPTYRHRPVLEDAPYLCSSAERSG